MGGALDGFVLVINIDILDKKCSITKMQFIDSPAFSELNHFYP